MLQPLDESRDDAGLTLVNPRDPYILDQRNKLLQEALRPRGLPYSILQEYPIVLSPDHVEFSLCLCRQGQVLGHANLWPRALAGESLSNSRIGLIGNVATSPSVRGQGFGRTLLAMVRTEAVKRGLDLLILWSDLDQFYQKLGFQAYGQELRFLLGRHHLSKCAKHLQIPIKAVSSEELSKAELRKLTTCRLSAPMSIHRTISEFRQLLNIPETFLFLSKDAARPGYGIAGKGYDMQRVLHEWGCTSPEQLVGMAAAVMDQMGWQEILILTPRQLPSGWVEKLAGFSIAMEEHSMALGQQLGTSSMGLEEELFIWGLDSI